LLQSLTKFEATLVYVCSVKVQNRGMKDLLVIFDCDGVLVDSEPVSNAVLTEMLAQVGLEMSVEECRRRFVGKAMPSVQVEVEAELGHALAPSWSEDVRDRTEIALNQSIQPVPGVVELVKELVRNQVPICVASSGRYSKMNVTLGKTGLLPYFEKLLFSAETVEIGKPAPDLFLYTLDQMGFAAAQAVIIEDSIPGVQAAVAASVRVLGYVGDPFTDRKAMVREGAEIFDSMSMVPSLLGLNR